MGFFFLSLLGAESQALELCQELALCGQNLTYIGDDGGTWNSAVESKGETRVAIRGHGGILH